MHDVASAARHLAMVRIVLTIIEEVNLQTFSNSSNREAELFGS